MASVEPLQKNPLLVYLRPDIVNYGLPVDDALKELDARISLLKGSKTIETNLEPIERVLYGTQLIGCPGHGILKLAQVIPTSVRKSYLVAKISKNSKVYVEIAETGFYIFMVCDRTEKNFRDMLSLI